MLTTMERHDRVMDFALSLVRGSNSTDSIVFCPTAIGASLGFMHGAANGETKAQIGRVMAEDVTNEEIEMLFYIWQSSFNNYESRTPPLEYHPMDMHMNGKLFARCTLKEEFIKADLYGLHGKGQTVNFADAAGTAKIIDDHIKFETNRKMERFISSEAINHAASSIITNVACLDWIWKTAFSFCEIEEKDFNGTAGRKRVEMMNSVRHVMYVETTDVEVISLLFDVSTSRFHHIQSAFVVFLPKKNVNLDVFVAGLTGNRVNELFSSMTPTELRISLPKFKLENTLELKPILLNKGIQYLFDENMCDLGGASDEHFHVNSVLHKVAIEISEDGAKASTASSNNALLNNPRPKSWKDKIFSKEKVFKAKRPFLFMITRNDGPLFIGTYR